MNPAVFAGVFAVLLAGRSSERTTSPLTSGVLLASTVWLFVGPLWILELRELAGAIVDRDGLGMLRALAMVSLTTPVLFPWLITRTLLIPFGRAKLAWLITRMSFWNWRGDVRSGAVIAASLAILRRADQPSELIAWAEAKRDATAPRQNPVRWKSGGATIVASGLLAAARGDIRSARRLLASASELVVESWPRRAVQVASEWLCAEAIERGDWRQVEFVARTSQVGSRMLELLASVAARLTGVAPLPRDLILRLQWLLAPRRRATRPLLAAALATPTTPKPRDERRIRPLEPAYSSDVLDQAGPLGLALALHVELLRQPLEALHAKQLIQVGQAWDHALASEALDRLLRERALVLGSRSDQALRTLIDEVEADLAERIRAARLPLAGLGECEGLVERVVRRMHADLLDALEIATSAFEARIDARRELPAIDEWQSFLALREQHADAIALAGPDLRRLAFTQLHGPICSLAVWLWNDRSERALGNAIFQWLLNEAIIVDDAEAIRLQEKNVACGI